MSSHSALPHKPSLAQLLEHHVEGVNFAALLAAAVALDVSTSTAEKDWAYARSWLRVAIDRMSGHRS